jgi:hypothetical protein
MMLALILTFSHWEKEFVTVCTKGRGLAQLRVLKNKVASGSPRPFWGEGEGEGQPNIPIALEKNSSERI